MKKIIILAILSIYLTGCGKAQSNEPKKPIKKQQAIELVEKTINLIDSKSYVLKSNLDGIKAGNYDAMKRINSYIYYPLIKMQGEWPKPLPEELEKYHDCFTALNTFKDHARNLSSGKFSQDLQDDFNNKFTSCQKQLKEIKTDGE